ncbi:hypothetical protein ASZ90_007273 [hydrocarbon metagenome]|uniref:Uncharacterized protein n=1 Tax=hydrocarbon metagenome TaxID=938273 RepID=A0A0W8FQB5_9ZZZZ
MNPPNEPVDHVSDPKANYPSAVRRAGFVPFNVMVQPAMT